MNPTAESYAFLEESIAKRTKSLFESYVSKIPWSAEDVQEYVADAGCGSGRITKANLLPHLPDNVVKITAFDLSSDMIRAARERYADPRIEYVVANLDDKQTFLPEWQGKFSKVFSHYCLHWLQDLHEGLRNVATILRPHGILFAVILTRTPLFEVAKELKNSPKWSMHCKGNLPAIPSRDADKEADFIRQALKETGFEPIVFDTLPVNLELPTVDLFKELLRSVGLFYTDIPEDLKDDYLTDYTERMIQMAGKHVLTGDKIVIIAKKVR